ncbi:DUF262 domain-containing protein [Nitratireductor sp.]|uniref:DUF262 domain-containing protein n=1 Tax=Nitratireductor sp. TaxID=1872084 RepID=UPI0025F2013E|nr:DUF262 domain-containing protein [Nitratireductor sp.]
MAYEDRDEPFEEQEPTEEAGTPNVTAADFSSLLISPTDWTIETLYRQIGNQIDLTPEFQRRNVWSTQTKISFIESLFLGVPIPQILLSASSGSTRSFLVLDGKQRLLTIKEFIDGSLPSGQAFRLKKLRVLKELEGKTWDEIEKNDQWSFELLNQTQRTAVIRGWEDERVLYEIFHRLNSGSVKLSPMELRMSLHPGDFLKFLIQWTETIGPLHQLISKQRPDPRMNDVELAARFLAFSDPDIVYAGDLKNFIDELCIQYNNAFAQNPSEVNNVISHLDNMNEAIDAGLKIFPDRKFCRKFTNGEYENQFNRAIFDVLVGALSHNQVREWALENKINFIQCYKDVSDIDDFRRSVETTTKSITSTKTRFTLFYDEISKRSGILINIPAIADEVTN